MQKAVVAVERGSVAERYAGLLRQAADVELRLLSADSAEQALRKGDVAVLLTGRDALVYRYDPARAESNAARLTADRVVQPAPRARPAVVAPLRDSSESAAKNQALGSTSDLSRRPVYPSTSSAERRENRRGSRVSQRREPPR